MAMTELGEVSKSDGRRTRGVSSAMPQKRNPISCAYIIATATAVQRTAGALVAGQAAADFRQLDRAMAGRVDRSSRPLCLRSCMPAPDCVPARRTRRPSRPHAPEPRPHRRADQRRGRDDGAGAHDGRERAHDLVHDVAQEVLDGQGSFAGRLSARPEVAAQLDEQALARVLDPTALGSAGIEVDQMLAMSP